MVKYKDKIIAYFDGCPDGVVVAANELYEKEFSKMSEAAFFKALERLAKSGIIQRVAKGMYMKSDSSKGDDVLNHFFGENNDNGVYIGTRLYNKYGISDVTSDEIWLYSNSIKNETCNIDNVHVKKADIELDYENARVIEALEILQNYYKIENLDKYKFARFARQFAIGYNDERTVYVLEHMKYKKSTIAFMKKILDMYKVENSLQKYLSYASRYKVPPVQRIAKH